VPYSIAGKSYRTFPNRIKEWWSDGSKITLREKMFQNKN